MPLQQAGKLQYILVLRDVTKEKQVQKLNEEKFKIQTHAAESMHEMGQPLFCIRTFTDSLLKGDLPSWATKRLQQIKYSNDLMSYKLMDVMDGNNLQHGTVSISNNSFRVGPTIKTVCDLLEA